MRQEALKERDGDWNMVNVCMIAPKKYPVPAVKGGAVEGLMELFLTMNERYGRIGLTVLSVWDEKAYASAGEYKKSTIEYIRYGTLRDRLFSSRAVSFLNRMSVRHRGKAVFEDPYIKRAYRKMQGKVFDLVLIEDGEYDIYGYLAKRIPKEKMCIHLHGAYEGAAALSRWFSRYICISNFVARNLLCNGVIHGKKVDVLKNGIDLERFQQELTPEEIVSERKNYGIADETVFVYWGRLIPEKGVKELLEAFKKVRAKKAAKLLIVGSSAFGREVAAEYAMELEALSKDVKGAVCFTGFIPNHELWRAIKIADIAVLPSIWDEAAGLSMLEAMAAGIPLITAKVGGIPEYVEGESAYWVEWSKNFADDLAEAMLKLAGDEELRRGLREHAKENVKAYSAKNYYEQYVRLILSYVKDGEGK